MARSKFNERAMRQMLARVRKQKLTELAEKVKLAAEEAAPRDSGEYASNFEIRHGKWVVWVANTSRYASIVEFGTEKRNYPRSRPLGRALDKVREG